MLFRSSIVGEDTPFPLGCSSKQATQKNATHPFARQMLLTPVFKLCTLFTIKEYQSPPGGVNGRLADREGEVIGWKPPQWAAIERRSDWLLKKFT